MRVKHKIYGKLLYFPAENTVKMRPVAGSIGAGKPEICTKLTYFLFENAARIMSKSTIRDSYGGGNYSLKLAHKSHLPAERHG